MEDGVRSGAHRGVRRGERGSGSRSVSVSARGSAKDGGERIEIEVRRRPSCLVGVGVESSGGGEGGERLQTEEEKCLDWELTTARQLSTFLIIIKKKQQLV